MNADDVAAELRYQFRRRVRELEDEMEKAQACPFCGGTGHPWRHCPTHLLPHTPMRGLRVWLEDQS